ncbi:MAG: SHOCT domain-containing protein [Thermoleophilaceae bacterium]|nr:SHOCT domain-containing protein [Thermoleophilaceae bacterium]
MAARTAVIAGTANKVQHKQNQKWAAQEQAQYDQQQVQAAPVAAAPVAAAEPDYMAELTKLAELKNQGIVTEEEFQAKKQQLLGL